MWLFLCSDPSLSFKFPTTVVLSDTCSRDETCLADFCCHNNHWPGCYIPSPLSSTPNKINSWEPRLAPVPVYTQHCFSRWACPGKDNGTLALDNTGSKEESLAQVSESLRVITSKPSSSRGAAVHIKVSVLWRVSLRGHSRRHSR